MTNGLYPVFLLSIILTRWIINVSLASILGYQIVSIYFWLQPSFRPPQTVPTVPIPTANKAVDISNIIPARLFGMMPAVVETGVANVPETKLNLKLHGIYYTTDNIKSFAVIAETEGKHRLYRQGATLSGGIVLQEIRPKEIIINRNGRYETLKLTSSSANSATTAKVAAIPSNPNKINDDNLTSAQLLANYQQQLRENPQKLLSLVRIEPVEQDGKFGGFRLSPGRDATLLNRFDLKSGDILVGVNGTALDSPLKGLSLIEQLGQTNQLNLAILRNGQPLSLSFNITK